MKNREFKLIKKYPGSLDVGTVLYLDNNLYIYWGTSLNKEEVENNPEFFEEIVEKKYEILSFICNKDLDSSIIPIGTIIKKLNSGNFGHGIIRDSEEKLLTFSHWDIHSIKRLSDNEVFSIGDKVDSTISDLGRATDITGFKVENDKLTVGLRHLGYYPLSTIILPKPVLFVTEDGKNVFEGDNFVAVNKKEIRISGHNLNTKNIPSKSRVWDGSDGYLQFSSVEKAQEWIVLNKPVLSINDVLDLLEEKHQKPLWKWSCTTQTVLSKFKELVKSRL